MLEFNLDCVESTSKLAPNIQCYREDPSITLSLHALTVAMNELQTQIHYGFEHAQCIHTFHDSIKYTTSIYVF